MLTIRVLESSEYDRLRGFRPMDTWIPSPRVSMTVVAERDGEIIGFWVAQPAVHVEPVWIKKGERNGLILGLLWRRMLQLIKGISVVFAFSPDHEISAYLSRLGFTEEKFTVFSRRGTS